MQPERDEHELVVRCIRGERTAQKALYDRYKNAMYTRALRITGTEAAASDALQDAFVEVFRDLEGFQGTSTLGAWIKTIVVRKALRQLSRPISFEPLDTVEADSAESDALAMEDLHRAILSLPEGYRTIFQLVEIDGFKHREVAEMLNISEATSKSQLSRSKSLLRKRLKPVYG